MRAPETQAALGEEIIAYLEKKHSIKIGNDDEIELGDIGEDCDFSLMFELAEIYGVADLCEGGEIGKYAAIHHAVTAIWELL